MNYLKSALSPLLKNPWLAGASNGTRQIKAARFLAIWLSLIFVPLAIQTAFPAESDSIVQVTEQPLAANINRLIETLDFLGAPLSADVKKMLAEATTARDANRLQKALDTEALFIVEINPETRVKARRGQAKAVLQQGAYTPVIVKIINLSTVTKELRITSPKAGQVYSGMTPLSAKRLQREPLHEVEAKNTTPDPFLDLEMLARPPMVPHLSALKWNMLWPSSTVEMPASERRPFASTWAARHRIWAFVLRSRRCLTFNLPCP
jgi:hypothetical protein